MAPPRAFDIVANTDRALSGKSASRSSASFALFSIRKPSFFLVFRHCSTPSEAQSSRHSTHALRDADIITHDPVRRLPGYTYAGMRFGDEGTRGKSIVKPVEGTKKVHRDYSIISGRYLDHHEEKKKVSGVHSSSRFLFSLAYFTE
jgi:hypothetical protein